MTYQAWPVAIAIMLATGCSLDGLVKSDELPPNVTDPAITKTPEGALAAYHGTVAMFRAAFGNAEDTGDLGGVGSAGLTFVVTAGLVADELRTGARLGGGAAFAFAEDRRDLPATYDSDSYRLLQKVRGQAAQAIGLLTNYAPQAQRSLVGHAYALEGYAEVFLAELYCSGIPLSTVDFDGNYTIRPGSTTTQVLTHAAALFDTALGLGADSARFVGLAAVGRARALLGLGQYAAAAAAVAAVPDDYREEVSYSADDGAGARNFAVATSEGLWLYSVADHDGINGLNYVTSNDPRVAVTPEGTNGYGYTVYRPDMYAADGSSPIALASGIEARLIEAEAALQTDPGDGVWLTKLNALRTDGTQDGGGVYNPGTGGVVGLAPLADPIADTARVSLVFRERAFWLFLTGHRQGDLRRLIRQYGRTHDEIYPVGPYPSSIGGSYGADVTLPVPSDERLLNPSFAGCASRGA